MLAMSTGLDTNCFFDDFGVDGKDVVEIRRLLEESGKWTAVIVAAHLQAVESACFRAGH